MASTLDLMQEAARRGILPAAKVPLYEEAVRRGLIEDARDRGFWGEAADAFERGARGAAQAVVADAATAGLVPPEAAAGYIAETQQDVNRLPVPPSVQRFFGARGWGESVLEFARSPLEITSTLVAQSLGSSLPSMAGGAVGAGLGSLASPVGTVAGGAVGIGAGSAATETGAKILESFAEHGVDLTDPAQVAAAFADGGLIEQVRGDAIKRGVTIGVFDAVSGALAGRLVTGARTAGQVARRGAAEVGIQAGLGMAGEAAGSAVIGDPISPPDVLAEGLGEIGPGAVEVAAGTAMRGLGAAGRARREDQPEMQRPPIGARTEDPYFTDDVVPPAPAAPSPEPAAAAAPDPLGLPRPTTMYGDGFTAAPLAEGAAPAPQSVQAPAPAAKPMPLPKDMPADPIQRAAHVVGQIPAGQLIRRDVLQRASGLKGNLQIRALLRALEGAGYAAQRDGRFVSTGRVSAAAGGTGGMGRPGPTTEGPPAAAPEPIPTQPEQPLPEFVPQPDVTAAAKPDAVPARPEPGTRVRVLAQDGSEFGTATIAGYTEGKRPRVKFVEGGVGPVKQPFADLVRMEPVEDIPAAPEQIEPAQAEPAGEVSHETPGADAALRPFSLRASADRPGMPPPQNYRGGQRGPEFVGRAPEPVLPAAASVPAEELNTPAAGDQVVVAEPQSDQTVAGDQQQASIQGITQAEAVSYFVRRHGMDAEMAKRWLDIMAPNVQHDDGSFDIEKIGDLLNEVKQGQAVGPRVMVNLVGRDGKTDAERGGPLPPAEIEQPYSNRPGDRAGDSGDRRQIGVNAAGNPVFEDARGVRSFVEDGVRQTESVALDPSGGASIDPARRGSNFKTTDEVAAAPDTPPPAAESTTPESQKPAAEPPKVQAAGTTPERPAGYGANNTFVTKDEAAELAAKIRAKIRGQLNTGFDPDLAMMGMRLAAFHIEAGSRKMIDMAKAIAEQTGLTLAELRPYLRAWYTGAQAMMEDSGIDVSGMDTPDQVRAALEEITSAPAPAAEAPPPAAEQPAAEQPAATPAADGDDRARIAEAFRSAFAGGRRFETIVQARKLASDILGRPVDASMAKMVEEAIEAGVVMRAREIVRGARVRGLPFAEVFDQLADLYAAQPLLNTRTSTSVEQQAYSTPAPLAYLASRLANVGPGLTVYEPSAGNGMLLMDASPAKVHANELNPDRFASLQRILGEDAEITNEDGAAYAPPAKVDRVIANPPFGKTKNPDRSTRMFAVSGMMTPEIDHAIAWKALEAMQDDGRAALIIGGIPGQDAERVKGYRAAKRLAFMKKLYDNFNVTEHFTVDGSLYERQGAGWPVDVIVIEGRGKSAKPLPSAVPPRIFGTWAELRGRLDGTVDSLDTRRKPPGRRSDPAEGGERAPDAPGVSVRPGQPDRPAGGEGRPGDRAPAAGGRGDPRPAVDPAGSAGDRGVDGGERGDARPGDRSEPDAVPGPDRETEAGSRAGDGARSGDARGVSGDGVSRPRRVERENLEAETAFQVQYKPTSNARFAVGTLVPRNMQQAMTRALDALSGRVGDIDAYVAEKLGYPLEQLLGTEDRPGYFSAEQVDALALAIDNVEGGGGFVIGDQTGVGKGRFVAAMLRYALQQGKTPVFMTKDPGLYADMVRDLRDIGMPDIASRILITNNGLRGDKAIPLSADDVTDRLTSLPDAKQKAAIEHIARTGSLPGDYEMLFTTYSQVQYGPKGTEIDRQRAIMSIAPNAIMVLDESHEAGGTEAGMFDKDTGAPVPTRAQFVRAALREAHGAVYSSATYAKNPTVMSLYFKTDLSLAVDDLDKLAETITAGGVPLQQVMANMLVEAGQYARRERSFEGVEMALDVLPTDGPMAERASTALRDVFNLDKDFMEEARRNFIDEMESEGTKGGKDAAIGESSASSTNFASIMHVVVSQMLLSLKAKAAVDKAIDLHRQGQKPIIALSNTNESIARDYIEDEKLRPGDPADLTFNAILSRYLRRLRRITLKDDNDNKSYVFLSDQDIRDYGGEDALAQYRKVEKIIQTIDLSGLPASPIDYILDRLNAAGVRADEITGRQDTLRGGKYTVRKGSTAEKKRAMNDYNSGKLDALVINKSGSTGFSLHATGKKGNDGKKRHMIVLQPDPNIDVFMQMLGRIHRTGQIKLPGYTIGVSDLAVEKRLAAVLMRKMASLNANTTASKKSAVSLDNVTDFMNKYGDEVVADFLRENTDVANMTDVRPGSAQTRDGLAAKLTGRLAIMPPDRVADIYDQIESAYREYIEALDRMGLNSLEARTLDLDARTIEEDVLVEAKGGGSPFAEAATIEVVDVRKLGKPYTTDELQEEVRKTLDGGTVSAYVAGVQAKLDQAVPDYLSDLNEGLRNAEKALEEAKSESQKDRAKGRIASWLSTIAEAETAVMRLKGKIAEFRPGSSHRLSVKDGEAESTVFAVVLGIDAKIKANPTAASAIRIRFAIADAGREVRVPLSKMVGEDPSYTAAEADPEAVRRAFDDGGQEAREQRQIITGNLVAGFGVFKKGQIVMFTDAEGRVRQGILMPKEFDAGKELEQQPVVFTDPAHVTAFLKGGPGQRWVHTSDKVLSIQFDGRTYVLQVNVRGGKPYFLNKQVRALVGDFQQRRGQKTQRAETNDARKVEQAIEIYQENLGARFVTTSHKDEARAITGQKVLGQETPGQDAPGRQDDAKYQAAAGPTSEQRAAAGAVRDLLARIAPGAPVDMPDAITMRDGRAAYGRVLDGIISIALNAPRKLNTARHEAIHWLRESGHLSEGQWGVLTRAVARNGWLERFDIAGRYPGLTPEQRVEEAIAEAYAAWADGTLQAKGGVAKVLGYMRRFFDRVREAIRSALGREPDWRDVFAAVEGGKVGRSATPAPRKTGSAFADMLLRGIARHLPAWHGSPHDFERFSLAKIGTGEGAQAFGWGMYFSSRKAIAEHYRKGLSRPGVRIGGVDHSEGWRKALRRVFTTDTTGPDAQIEEIRLKTVIDAVEEAIHDGISPLEAFDRATEYHLANLERLRHPPAGIRYDRQVRADLRQRIADIGVETFRTGRIYEVELSPEPEHLLDWDKPLSEQSEYVRERLDQLEVGERDFNFVGDRVPTGKDAYEALSERLAIEAGRGEDKDIPGSPAGWGAIANVVNDKAANDRAASLALLDAGIPGLRYLDAGSRSKGEGAHNYVIFDENAVEVRAKFQAARDPIAAEISTERDIGRGATFAQVREKARAFLRGLVTDGRKVTNRQTGMRIAFNLRGAKKSERGGEGLLKAALALPQMLEQGTYLGAETPKTGKERVARVHKFTAAVMVDGERIDTVLIVEERNDGTFHYGLNRDTGIAESISDISRGPLESDGRASGRDDAGTGNVGPDDDGAKFQVAESYRATHNRDIAADAGEAREQSVGFLRRVVGRLDKFLNPIEGLPEIRTYLAERYRTYGTIARVQDVAGHLTQPFANASPADAEAVYEYLTTAEASPRAIADAGVRKAAVDAKRAIDRIGRQLVAKGLLSQEAYDRHKDAYLPRVYLRHLLEQQGVSGAATVTAGGKKVSDLGYLKQRKDIPEDVRRYILGQILDPQYLATRALVKPARDIALLDFLDYVSRDQRWIIPWSVVSWNGQRVTVAWLKAEAARLRRMTDHQPAEDAAVTREIAAGMESAADAALREMGMARVDMSDYRQVPDAPRYGRMRGLWVRQEIHEDLVGSTQWVTGDGGNFAQRLLGQGGTLTKATQLWKLGKVALNPPTQVRNAISNAIMLHLSGVNGMMVIPRLIEAIGQMRSRGEYWQVAQRYGITEATFAHNELFRLEAELKEALDRSGSPLARVATLFGKIGNAAGDLYQATEAAFKIAKIIDEMKKGRSAETAALEAQKWLFDYSLVSGTTQYLRNAPLGVPFITYYTKVMPRLIEVAATAPWRLAPYFTIPMAMAAWVAAEWDVDDDDLDKLRAALPEWLRNRGTGVVPLPYKDGNGNWQFVDLSFFFPWAMFEGLGRAAASGDVTQFLSQAGILGGPVPQIISAIQTGVDPFSGKPIVDEYDRPAKKLASLLNFAWSLAMPPWMTEYGFANRLWQATQGVVDPRTGKPRYTEEQALLRAVGVNVYPIDPVASRAGNLRRMEFEIREVKARMKRELRNQNLTDDQRREIAADYREMLAARAAQMRQYAVDSEVNPKLLRAAP